MKINTEKMKEEIKQLEKEFPSYKSEIFTAVLFSKILSSEHTELNKKKDPVIESIVKKNESIRGVFNKISPKNNSEKVAAFGFYLENIKMIESYGIELITQCFNDAREKMPKNLHRDIRDAIKLNLIMPIDTGKYCLTNDGRKIFEERLQNGSKTNP